MVEDAASEVKEVVDDDLRLLVVLRDDELPDGDHQIEPDQRVAEVLDGVVEVDVGVAVERCEGLFDESVDRVVGELNRWGLRMVLTAVSRNRRSFRLVGIHCVWCRS